MIQARLETEGIEAAVDERGLFELADEDRHAALDAMVAFGAEPPFVLVGGELACSGGIDTHAIVEVARRVAGVA
ncbi:hypothetical protein MX659_00630 [Coriobacteriia bacterium Es71-Z0120]|uniref:hypothetical protein n=1 Tax=Parvivirga hydrogeniphila TaxID=2939460 RepID=UPI0022609CEF|nr:hypothetical protein [Parvivirga hydrogeniphila]MCL4078119.1 hypothetical protein [Parvivirga hydrogeniphila]